MSYHPIMGISFFIISIVIAYYIGRYIKKKYKSSKSKDNKTDYGDAAAPDAPWMKKNKN